MILHSGVDNRYSQRKFAYDAHVDFAFAIDPVWIGFCNGYIQAAFDATGGKKLLKVECSACKPSRHLYIEPQSLGLPKRMPVPEVANHLVCSVCGARNNDTYHPIWARPDARVSGATGQYPDYSTLPQSLQWRLGDRQRSHLLAPDFPLRLRRVQDGRAGELKFIIAIRRQQRPGDAVRIPVSAEKDELALDHVLDLEP